MFSSDAQLGVTSAFLSSVTWAVGISTYTRLSKQYPAYQVHLGRIVVALPIFTAFIFFQAGGFSAGLNAIYRLGDENLIWAFVSALASFAIGDVLFLWSTVALGAPAALAIASTYPFWSAVAGMLFKGETLTLLKVLGLIFVVAGTVTVILAGYRKSKANILELVTGDLTPAREKKLLEQYPVGLFLAFLTSIAWALNSYSGMKAADGVTVFTANAARMGMALILCPLVGAAMTRSSPRLLPAKEFKRYGWVFAFEGFGGSTFYIYGLANAPLAIASALSSLAPVLAVPIGLLLKTEKFSLLKTVGVAMVVAGVSLLV